MERLTAEEFAQELKVHRATVLRWCERSLLGHHRIGRVVRIPRKDADEFLRRHYQERYERKRTHGSQLRSNRR